MEDYQTAFFDRHQDTEILCASSRKIAAMHFGGITIECLLKSIILSSCPKGTRREWKTDTNNPGHTITNPGHSFQDALRRHNILRSRIQKFPDVMKWLEIVENPNQHFIDMRYSIDTLEESEYKKWFSAYRHLLGWLQKQATQL
jgi:hypothetical protein